MKGLTCELCPAPAAWRWDAGAGDPFYLCDHHAASKDLDDLDDLRGVDS